MPNKWDKYATQTNSWDKYAVKQENSLFSSGASGNVNASPSLGGRPRYIPQPKNDSIIKDAYDVFTTPNIKLPSISGYEKLPIPIASIPGLSLNLDTIKGGIEDQTSLAGIGTAALPFAKAGGIAGKGLSLLGKGFGTLQGARGVEEISEGNVGQGALDIGMGAFGILGSRMPKIEKPTVVLPTIDPLADVAAEPVKLFRRHVIPGQNIEQEIGANAITNRGTTPIDLGTGHTASMPDIKFKPGAFKKKWDQFGNVIEEKQELPIPQIVEKPGNYKVTFDAQGNKKVISKPDLQPTTLPQDKVIPNVLKPVTPNESAFNAMIPERYKTPGIERLPDGTIRETRFPAGKTVGETVSIKTPDKEIFFEATPHFKSVVKAVEKAGEKSPEIKAVIGQYPEAIERAAGQLSSIGKIKKFYNNMIGSRLYKELENDSPAGKEISVLLAKVSHTTRERASAWDVAYDDIAKNLNETEMDEFWSAMDYGQPSKNTKVNEAVRVAREVDAQRTGLMAKNKLTNPETGELTQARRDYAPRIYPAGFWEDPKKVYDALVTKFPNITPDVAADIAMKKSSPELIDRIMKSAGVERKQAEAIARLGVEHSERKIASQFSRDLNLPGYRKDINVWKEHNWDIAKKTAEMEHYGTLDVADPNSPISKLIEQTTNPAYTSDLVKLQIGRVERDRFARQMEKVNSLASKATSALYLSQFAISNVSGLLAVPMQAGMKNFAKAFTQTIATNKGASKAFASESGAMYNITKGILEHSSGSISKLFGINASENFNRTVSAVAGKLAAEDYFATLKSGKLSDKYAKLLEDITLTPRAELIKQDALTPQQTKFAGGRMSELTQGLAEARNVPVYASSPYMQLPWMFKKYAFQQTANMKDAIMRDPIKNIPLWLAGSQIFGEIVGDAKAVIKGGVTEAITGKSDISEEVRDRGSYLEGKLGNNKVINRMVDNMQVGFALGLFADLYQMSTSNKDQMASEFLGPAAGTVFTGLDTGTDALAGDPKPLGRELLRRTPFIGSGLQQGLLPTDRQRERLNRNAMR